MGVAPPSFVSTASYASWAGAGSAAAGDTAESFVPAAVAPAFEPGLPALRVESNVARVAVGLALEVVGLGPFSMLGNHLSTGGPIPISGAMPAMTVAVLNLGAAIELERAFSKYADIYRTGSASASGLGAAALAGSSNGTVLFANNICQLETRASRQKGFSSVFVASFDHVLFTNNQCWLDSLALSQRDGKTPPVALDAILLAMTLQVNGNRFQESINSVLASAFTYGCMNVTGLNMSTYPVFANAADATKLATPSNISWA